MHEQVRLAPSQRHLAPHPTLAHFSGDQRTKTIMHEAAHWLADHRGSVARCDAETVAESSAFVVLARYGIDAGSYTFPYVAHRPQDKAVLRRNLAEVQGVAAGLIAGIEAATAIFRRPMCGQSTSDGGR